jgi:predicted Zn-dependent protease
MKKSSRFALPLIGAALLAGCSASPQEQFADAQKAYAAHEYPTARINLTAALREDPGNVAMLDLLARTQLELADGEGAMVALDQLARLNKLPADGAVLYGEALLLKNLFKDALTRIEALTSAPAQRIRALAEIGLDDPAAAAAAFAKGVEAKGDKSRLYADYARFKLTFGDKVGARELADQAMAAAPKQIDSLLALGAATSAQGQLAEALAAYDKALKLYPRSRAALVGKAGVLGDLGRLGEMEPLLKVAAGDSPNDPDVAYLLARAFAEKGNWKGARDTLQKMEGALAERTDAQVLYAQALLRNGQVELALAQLNSLVRRYPAHRLARRLLAEAQLGGGDAAGALATMRPLADLPGATAAELALAAKIARAAGDPDAAKLAERAKFPTPEALASELGNADAALKAKNWKAAISAYDRILAVTDGKNVMVLNNMAYAQSQAGNKKVALDYAQKALALAPGNASVPDTVGWLMIETGGDRAKAVALLRKAAALAPGNQTIADHLARATAG